jgi:hypothetical protein
MDAMVKQWHDEDKAKMERFACRQIAYTIKESTNPSRPPSLLGSTLQSIPKHRLEQGPRLRK